jgi:uncharacterized protein
MRITSSAFMILLAIAPAVIAAPSDVPSQLPVTLKTAAGILHGTLELPAGKGRFPVALIIAGSGPTDRDGNAVKLGLHPDSYKLLAGALAKAGIASLRYDKRGAGDDTDLIKSENKLRIEDYVEDASVWGKRLQHDKRFSRLVIIGHSEGSLIGMLAAHEIRADAYISVAGAGEPAQILLLKQLQPKLPADLYQQSNAIIDNLTHGKTVAKVPDDLRILFRPSLQPYLISWFRYDPAKEIARLEMPVLIVQGRRDLQVGVDDAKMLQQADPQAKLVLIPDMNHVLKDVSASYADNLASYSEPKRPLDRQLTSSIIQFIQRL